MTAVRRYRRDLHEVPMARRFVADEVEGAQGAVSDELLLAVSELVTNAVRHGAGTMEVRVTVQQQVARVEVLDEGGSIVPEPAGMPPAEAVGGRGLHLVRGVSQAWGSGVDAHGRTLVWAEIPIRATAAPERTSRAQRPLVPTASGGAAAGSRRTRRG